MMKCSHADASEPPNSRGQCEKKSPASASFGQKILEKLVTASEPGLSEAVSCQSDGRCVLRNERTFSRTASSCLVHPNSINHLFPCHGLAYPSSSISRF